MSDQPERDTSGNFLIDAVAKWADKHGAFLERHPSLEKATGLALAAAFTAVAACSIVAYPITSRINKARIAKMPLEEFEPKHDYQFGKLQQAPFWQKLVFDEGRLEKLLQRLDGQPQVEDIVQKTCLLNSEGGLRVLPGHRELIKYGLNDTQILYALHSVDRQVHQLTQHHGLTLGENTTLIMTKEGVFVENDAKTPVMKQGEHYQYSIMGLTDLIDVYRACGCKDEQAIAIANKTSQAIYAWLAEDVAPVIPNLFYGHYDSGYNAKPQPDGSLKLERNPYGYQNKTLPPTSVENEWDYIPPDLIQAPRKDLYDIFADGYKGTLPVYTQENPVRPNGPQPL